MVNVKVLSRMDGVQKVSALVKRFFIVNINIYTAADSFATLILFVSTEPLVGEYLRQAMAHEFRFIAGIVNRVEAVQPERDLLCGGSLISGYHILSSAHCIENKLFNSVQIIVGSTNLNSTSRYYPAWWLTYDQWAIIQQITSEFTYNDIIIIRLTSYVPVGIPRAIIAYIPYEELIDASVVTVGWGEINNETFPLMLHTINLKILSKANCESIASELDEQRLILPGNILCTREYPFALLMMGDSGGPILYMHRIVGINVGSCPFPEQHFHPDRINLHVSIYHYENFITKVTECF